MTVLDRQGNRYREGDEALFEVPFTARLGGGTYHLRLIVTDRNDRETLVYDSTGLSMYIDPAPGVGGFADLRAAIHIDGSSVSEYPALLLSPRRAASIHDVTAQDL
jgi:hypothetical protein